MKITTNEGMNEKTSLGIVKIILIILGTIILHGYYSYSNNSTIGISIYLAATVMIMYYTNDKTRKALDIYIDGALVILWSLIFICKSQYWLFLAIVFLFIISSNGWYLTCENCRTSLQYLRNENKKEFVIAMIIWIVFIASIFVIS